MILSDKDLKARLARGDLVVGPMADPELQLQPASIDVRLDREFIVYRPAQIACLDPRDGATIEAATERIVVDEEEGFILHPGEFGLGSTVERVTIPADLVARVDGRSSIGRLAVVVHATAGFIDPGFSGQITLELSNIGPIPVRLYPGMRVAQLVLYTMTSAAERPYGPARGSRYQHQQGPVVSRISRDSG
ncbi:MAG: dCTP deaminase [Myxococcales bacterium]|nr:dCTP deaminase [Myxococcales bacterium]MDD9968196.1 dCTP deaminase [Myxococcales bacterium]